MKLINNIRFLILLIIVSNAAAQSSPFQDSEYISHFERKNIVEVNTGFNKINFNFNGLKKDPSSFRLAANTNAYTGINVNYKWVSVSYAFAIPGTLLDNNVRLKHVLVSFRYNYRQWSIIPFYYFYNGLLLQSNQNPKNFNAFRDMNFYDGGFKLLHFTNTKNYSYRSATSFSEQQKKSVGSFILIATPRWRRIDWKSPNSGLINDSVTYHLLASNPQFISLTAGGGYNYNFIFKKGKWIVSPALIIGAGALKELNRNGYVQPVFNFQTWVNAGYNGDIFYSYVNVNWENTQTQLITKNLNGINRGVSLTVGYRFKNFSK